MNRTVKKKLYTYYIVLPNDKSIINKKKNLKKLLNKTIKKYSNNENIYNDISMLEETRININYYPKSIDEIINIIKDANFKKKKICMSGQKHSMGGHTLIKNGIFIDLKNFNKMEMVSHFKDLNLILKKKIIFLIILKQISLDLNIF